MKKLLILATMACAALVSCVKNEPAPSVTAQQEITFAPPVVGVATKGDIELPVVYPETGTFGVFARYYAPTGSESGAYTTYEEGAVYMDNVNVSSTKTEDITSWSAEGYYWPKNGGTLTFAAYSPFSIHTGTGTDQTAVTHTENGIQINNYTVDDKADVDVLFSERAYDKTASSEDDDSENVTDTDTYYGVDIEFKHALAAIAFKAKADDNLVPGSSGVNYTFKITKIELLKVNSNGSFNQGLTEKQQGATENPQTPEASDNDWESSTPKDYTAYTNSSGLLVGWDEDNSKYTGVVSTVTDGDDKNKYANLILMPQTLKHENDQEVSVKVTYDFRHTGMGVGTEDIKDNTAETTLVLSTEKTDNWLRGKRYVYTLILSLDKIELEPTVEDWTDVPGVSENVITVTPV